MIILVTGQPGSGKTAFAVDALANDPQFKGRPLLVMGVEELAIPHEPVPPVTDWVEFRQAPEDPSISLPYFAFPQNSVVLIDEAQRVYRPRSAGSKVPDIVAAFETHRHVGVDFVLITQQVGLLDSNIRKLIGRHIHIRITPLGRFIYEWPELGDPELASSRQVAARKRYKLPSRAFGLYKSAEIHTKIKASIPGYFYVLAVALALLISFVAYGWYRYQGVGLNTASPSNGDKVSLPDNPPPPGRSAARQPLADYLADRVPRLSGQLHTAPVYDEITKPTEAPMIAGCVRHSGDCRCYTQQGTIYETSQEICEQFMQGRYFQDWRNPEKDVAKLRQDVRNPEKYGAELRQDVPLQAQPIPPGQALKISNRLP